MISLKNRNLELILLNGIGIIVYTFVFFNLNIDVSNEIAFSTPDSQEYLEVANWLENGTDSKAISTRPILYPILLLITTKIGGVIGLCIIQFLFWLLTANFLFLIIKELTRSKFFAFVGAIIFLSNLSVIALTLHALTEVITIFLVSMMFFFLIKNREKYKEPHFFQTLVFYLVLLTVLKPVFSIPLYCTLGLVFPLFYLKKYLRERRHFIKLLVILLPLIIQILIVKTKFDQITVSKIGSKTLTNYFFAQGIQKIDSTNRESAIELAKGYSQSEQMDYMYEHSSVYLNLFFKNIQDNLTGKPTYLLYPVGHENLNMAEFMQKYNRITGSLHYLFIFLIIPLLIILLKKRKYSLLIPLSISYLLLVYYILVTGISFFQGDRLTIASIAIWSFLYPAIIWFYFNLLHPNRTLFKHSEI